MTEEVIARVVQCRTLYGEKKRRETQECGGEDAQLGKRAPIRGETAWGFFSSAYGGSPARPHGKIDLAGWGSNMTAIATVDRGVFYSKTRSIGLLPTCYTQKLGFRLPTETPVTRCAVFPPLHMHFSSTNQDLKPLIIPQRRYSTRTYAST